MSLTKKRLSVIGAGLAVAGLTIGGVAYAAFNQTGTANADGAGSESFAPLGVTGQWLGRSVNNGYPSNNKLLLPGESGDVKITLSNPASNTVQGKVLSIKPIATAPDGCTDSFTASTYTPGNQLVLGKDSTISVVLKDAIGLKEAATEACQGQPFPTNFEVKFQATREAVKTQTSLQPDSAAPVKAG